MALTGMNLTLKPNQILTQFGGKDISSYTNILFRWDMIIIYGVVNSSCMVSSSNGGLDPWSAGGVLQSLTNDLPAVFIPDGAHHLDLRAKTAQDPEDLLQARKKERDFLDKLLSNA